MGNPNRHISALTLQKCEKPEDFQMITKKALQKINEGEIDGLTFTENVNSSLGTILGDNLKDINKYKQSINEISNILNNIAKEI